MSDEVAEVIYESEIESTEDSEEEEEEIDEDIEGTPTTRDKVIAVIAQFDKDNKKLWPTPKHFVKCFDNKAAKQALKESCHHIFYESDSQLSQGILQNIADYLSSAGKNSWKGYCEYLNDHGLSTTSFPLTECITQLGLMVSFIPQDKQVKTSSKKSGVSSKGSASKVLKGRVAKPTKGVSSCAAITKRRTSTTSISSTIAHGQVPHASAHSVIDSIFEELDDNIEGIDSLKCQEDLPGILETITVYGQKNVTTFTRPPRRGVLCVKMEVYKADTMKTKLKTSAWKDKIFSAFFSVNPLDMENLSCSANLKKSILRMAMDPQNQFTATKKAKSSWGY